MIDEGGVILRLYGPLLPLYQLVSNLKKIAPMKFLIVALDYAFALSMLLLFLILTPFGEHWPLYTIRLLFVSAILGMGLAQILFPVNLGRTSSDIGLLFRNALGISCTYIIGTYITMRIIDHPGVDTGRWLALIGVVFFLLFLIFRYIEKLTLIRMWSHGYKAVRIIAVGNGNHFLRVVKNRKQNPGQGFRIVGCYTDGECPEGIKMLGTTADSFGLINDGKDFAETSDALLCGFPMDENTVLRQYANYCNSHVLRFYYVPSDDHFRLHLYPMLIGSEEVFTAFRLPLSLTNNKIAKRTFDVVFSICVLIPLAIITPIIALIIKIQSPGPIFFKQARTGMDGRTFMCYKFRSMHVNKDADKVQATKDDPRKFPFGNFMRKCNIDELPQFWNVLKNDMSIVGPRPHMLKHTEMYSALLNRYMVRHFVKPGITGWAQETGFRGETKELWQMEGRVKCDIWYIEHWTFWLDIRIVLMTIKSIFVHDQHAY